MENKEEDKNMEKKDKKEKNEKKVNDEKRKEKSRNIIARHKLLFLICFLAFIVAVA